MNKRTFLKAIVSSFAVVAFPAFPPGFEWPEKTRPDIGTEVFVSEWIDENADESAWREEARIRGNAFRRYAVANRISLGRWRVEQTYQPERHAYMVTAVSKVIAHAV